MIQIFRTATMMLLVMTTLTGLVYPVAMTVIGQVVFPYAANGSLMTQKQDSSTRLIGSGLVGQPFNDAKYFWSRPSSTAPFAYNGLSGSGSNLGPTNPMLLDAVKERVAKLKSNDPENTATIPVDLVTTSASGLDPHISEAAARYQISRVARLRQIERKTLERLVEKNLELPTAGIFGQARVNVLKLNLDLDQLDSQVSMPTSANE